MLEVYVDPWVVACQDIGHATELEGEQLVQRLLHLRALTDGKAIALYFPVNTYGMLESARCYPIGARLHRCNHQQRRDVATILNRLLSGISFEDRTKVDDLVVESSACSPDSHLENRTIELAYEYHRMLAIAELVSVDGSSVVRHPIVLTRGLPFSRGFVRAEGTVPVCVDKAERREVPYSFSADIWNVGEVPLLFLELHPVELWIEGHYDLALTAALVQRGWMWRPELERDWSIGASFTRSAQPYGFTHEPSKVRRMLSACVDTVLGENVRTVHELRVGAGPGDAQRFRERDKALAWRRDIDDEYHLHYWKAGGTVELANVVVHNTFGISE